MKRREFLQLLPKATLGMACAPSLPMGAPLDPHWWRGTGFVPTGPVTVGMAKVCFEGMYPRQGRSWIRGDVRFGECARCWIPVEVGTRGPGLDMFNQRGWLWVGEPSELRKIGRIPRALIGDPRPFGEPVGFDPVALARMEGLRALGRAPVRWRSLVG